MANNCTIDIGITVPEGRAEKLYQIIKTQIEESDKAQHGWYFGTDNRWLFDAQVDYMSSSNLLIDGWVKWCLESDEFEILCRNLVEIEPGVSSVICKVWEPGCEVCIRYTLDRDPEKKAGVLTVECLGELFPALTDEDWDNGDPEGKCFAELDANDCVESIQDVNF